MSVLEGFKDRYSDHWRRIYTDLLGIPADHLDGKWHDAPCCGAPGAFRIKGSVSSLCPHCEKCGGEDERGGPMTDLELARRCLRLDSSDAARKRIDAFLGGTRDISVERETSAWKTASDGRWPEILQSLGGLSPDQLENRHQPCPACGGADRYRWDNDEGAGGWYCNKCGGRDGQGGGGNGMDLLMRVTGWQFRDAATAVERHLGLSEPALLATGRARANRKPYRRPDKPPIDARPPDRRGAVFQWCYRNAAGEPLFWIQRVNLRDGKKLFVHRTWLDGRWHRPSKNDEFTCEWPTPRPIYGLDRLAAAPDAVVLLAEGEKSADASHEAGDGFAGISWPNGSKAIHKIDWSPLQGRQVVILRDNDDDGLVCTRGLIRLLGDIAASVAVADPPAGAPPKWDVADPWPQGEGRTVAEWLAGAVDGDAWLGTEEAGDGSAGDGGEPPLAEADEPVMGERWPFAMLGFNGSDMFYQPSESGQVMSISRNNHNSSTLIGLARLEFWETRYGRFNRDGECTGVRWTQAASDLVGRQYEIGVYDPKRIRGVGAWWDNGRVFYHLGDRICVDGHTWPVLEPPPSTYLYQRLPRREGQHGAEPLTDIEGNELLSLAERFHWEVKASGILLAGWVALAPICGVLQWRPHIWLNAVAGSGKSSLMKYFVQYLLGDLPLRVIGNTTEAGIRQTLKSDALPILFDEAESNSNADAARIQSVLSLARISSTDDQGVTLKGSPSAEATMFNVRSMFFLSSINTALKQGADRSRFSVLVLRVPDNLTEEKKQEHWNALKDDLVRAITPETGKRMIARMVALAGMVRETATVMAQAAALELGSARQGDQIGALLAGAYALQHQEVPTLEQARAWVKNSGVREQSEGQADERGGDQGDCLQTILQTRLRVEAGKDGVFTRTVAELIETASRWNWQISERDASDATAPADAVHPALAVAELGRNGIAVKVDEGVLLISNTAKGIARMLAGTPWANGGWSTLLASLPGAKRSGVTRFRGLASATRSVAVPASLLLATPVAPS